MKKKEKISKAKSPDTSKKQKKAEEKLRYDLFFALAEQSSDIILLVNREGIVSYANPAVSILGLNAEERIGANAFEHVHPDDIKIITDSFHILFSDANAHTQRAEVRLRCMNGGWRTFEAMGSSLVHDNVVESAIVNLRDITERKRMEEKLWQEQLEIQAIMDASPIGVSWSDMQGNIKYNNCRFQELFGYTVEDMPDIATWLLLAYPSLSYREQVSSQVMLIMDAQDKGKETDPLELTVTCKDGSIRQVLHTIVITHNRILAIFYDITERKRTEEKLFLISKAVESSSNAIGLSDPQGHHFYHNKAFTELFEYTPEDLEAAGGGPAVFVNKKVAHEVFDAIMSGRSWIGEVEIISKSGRKFPVNLRADAIKNEKGEIVGLIGVHTDITERKKSEEALKESEAKYRLLAEHTKDTVWVTDLNLKVNYISLSAEKLLGYTLDEIIPIPLDKLLTPATFKAAMDFYALELSKALAAPPDYVLNRILELEFICKNGRTIWAECMFSLIRDDNGEPLSILGEAREITQRKQIEDALRKSEEKYRSILENIREAYFEVDLTGNFTFFNDSLCRMTGCSRDELLGANYTKFSDKQNSKNVFQAFNKVYRTGDPTEGLDWLIIRKDGTKRYIEASVSLKKDLRGNPSGFKGVIRDVTERKQAEETIKKSEEKYRSIFANAIEGIYQVTMEGKFLTANNAIARMAGYDSPEELMESIKNIKTQLYVHPEERDRLLKIMRTQGFVKDFEAEWRKKDGKIFWVALNALAVKDEQGNILYNEGLVEDITIRKQAEEKLKQSFENLKRAVNTTIHVLGSALESRDPYTAGHQSRVADIACAIAKEMGLAKDKKEGLRMAGVIHDIGKLSVPTEILTKPTKLTDLEFSLVKEHAQSGYEMLKDVESPWPLADIVHQHHERINGSGYPRKLKGNEILLEARILAVADVVEAMASHRPYRASLGIDIALEEIAKNKGILYDEAVADACLKLFREKGYQLT